MEIHIAGAELGSAVAEALGPAAATYITMDFFQHDTQATPPGHGLRRARALHACLCMLISQCCTIHKRSSAGLACRHEIAGTKMYSTAAAAQAPSKPALKCLRK